MVGIQTAGTEFEKYFVSDFIFWKSCFHCQATFWNSHYPGQWPTFYRCMSVLLSSFLFIYFFFWKRQYSLWWGCFCFVVQCMSFWAEPTCVILDIDLQRNSTIFYFTFVHVKFRLIQTKIWTDQWKGFFAQNFVTFNKNPKLVFPNISALVLHLHVFGDVIFEVAIPAFFRGRVGRTCSLGPAILVRLWGTEHKLQVRITGAACCLHLYQVGKYWHCDNPAWNWSENQSQNTVCELILGMCAAGVNRQSASYIFDREASLPPGQTRVGDILKKLIFEKKN